MIHRSVLASALVLATLSPALAIEFPSFGGWFSSDSDDDTNDKELKRGGGREWWRRHESKAILVPGQGYKVPGFSGFYDGAGVPIDAPVDQQTIRLRGNEDDEPTGILPGLDPKKAANRVREAAGYGPDEQAARELLNEGVELADEKKYGRAASKFKAAAARWPNTALAAQALFNLGESHYFDEDLKAASDAYIDLLDKHPSTPRLDATVERLWRIAQFWEQTYFFESWRPPFDFQPFRKTRPTFDTIGHALRLYDAIRLNDPTGPRADDSIMAIAGIHFRRNAFADADYHYRLLREEYPRSEHQFEAHLLGLQALLQRYQGPDYDGSPLRAAERLEEQTRLNFAGRLSAEDKDRLTKTRAQVAAAIQQRDLRMADYYEGKQQVGAARYYLAQAARDYAGSPAAETAQERLAELEGRPDNPPVRLAWLVDLLPENKRFESINSIEEIDQRSAPPAAGRTLVADESQSAGQPPTKTR